MKNLLYFDLYSERRVPELMNANWKRTQLFQKYFPKYLRRFSYISRNVPVASKVKRAKIIQDFETSHILESSQDWRILLGNKMKSVKVLSNFNKAPLQFSENIKLFSELRTIEISMPDCEYFGPVKVDEYLMERACKLLRRLRKLKCLEICQLTQSCGSFLKKLNLFPKILSSLERLDISFEKKAATDPELLKMFLQNHSIVKYMTHLNLRALCSNSHFQSFASLTSVCPNLFSLTFEFSCRNIVYNPYGLKYFALGCFQVNTDYLQIIKGFQNLRVLNLDIADTFTFLKDFALPTSAQKLRLNFEECLSKEIMKKLDPNFPNLSDSELLSFFQENKTLLKFYESFQYLKNLDTLELVENRDSDIEAHKYQNYLSQCFMKRLFSVKKLSLKFSPGFNSLTPTYWNMKEDVNLAPFFASCHHLGKSLETLEIGHEDIIFPKVNLSDFHGKFINLSTIKVKGQFYEFDRRNDKIGPLLKQIGSLGDKITAIKLCTFAVGMVGPLLTLLRQVNRLNIIEEVKIELQIKFFGFQILDDLRDGFIVPINDLKTREGYQKARGVSLKLFTEISSENMREFLRVYGEKFESFEILPRDMQFQ